MIVLCLAGLIAHIMSKALKRDITQYEVPLAYTLISLYVVNEVKVIRKNEESKEETKKINILARTC